ncbi:MAG: type II secretion system secretin GspD [Bdellovibrionota bacterium]
MKLSKPNALLFGRIVLSGLLVTSLVAPSAALAQNDELDNLFEQEELDDPPGTFSPPPPPPPTDFSTTPPPDSGGNPGFPQDPPSGFGGSAGGTTNPRPAGPGGVNMKVAKPDKNRPSLANAGIEDITEANYPDIIESFDYPNAEISDLVKVISQLTGKNFILDPGVRGKISIIAPTQISVAEAYKAFLSALAINGFTVVPSGKFLKVKSARNAQRDSIETYSGQYYPNSDIMITRIIHLKHISAEEVNKRLRILPSKDGEMTPYEPTNSLIISDYGANIERIMKIINDLDRPGFEEQLAVVPIRYAGAKNLADLINQIINKDTSRGGGAAAGGFGAGVPRFRSRGGTAGGGTPEELSLIAADDRTNAIIIVGNKAGIQKVKDLVRKLDYKLDPAEAGGVNVYYVKYGEAEKIAATLGGIASGSSTGAGGATTGAGGAAGAARPLDRQNVFGGEVKIVADKSSNALVITASKVDYETVTSLLAKIDIPRDQVYVEAIIMEMNTQKVRAWNPTYYYLDPSSGGIGRAGFSSGDLASLGQPANDKGTILGFGSGEKVKLTLGSATVEVPSLLAFIRVIQQNTESNILSTPGILALDNEDAEIEVGDKVPVGIATTTSTNGQTTAAPQFENATIKLQITPAIRPDSDVVRMKIVQQIKQPSKTQVAAQLAAATTVLSDRSIKTNIVVHDGDTAILGGLVRDEESVDETKVPILGDIPVLGWLFKSHTVEKKKVNLVVFLTPKIIRGVEDSQGLVSKKTNQRIDWLKKNFDGRDPYGTTVDALPRRADAAEVDAARSIRKSNTSKKK